MPQEDPNRTFPLHHGRLSLSFAGTVSDRGSAPFERLESPQALAAWFRATAIASGPVTIGARAFGAALRLREAIARTAAALVAGTKPARDDIALINDTAKKSPARIALDPDRLTVVDAVRDPVAAALGTIARDAIELFGSAEERGRLRACGLTSCASIFLTPAGRRERRWCSMARCGNRAKVSAHRKRAEREPAPTSGTRPD
jgi:predicted RNA-binding Zn ribbon-like protein